MRRHSRRSTVCRSANQNVLVYPLGQFNSPDVMRCETLYPMHCLFMLLTALNTFREKDSMRHLEYRMFESGCSSSSKDRPCNMLKLLRPNHNMDEKIDDNRMVSELAQH